MAEQTLTGVLQFIRDHDRLILTSHETPDGDAIGSEVAMARMLKSIGKEVLIFNADPTPESLRFLDLEDEIRVLTDPSVLPDQIDQYALLILDVGDPDNIGHVKDWILPRVAGHMFIDHHEMDDWDRETSYVDRGASSTSEILHRVGSRLQAEIDLPAAQALFLGIVYDTGSFAYPKTTASTFKTTHDLVRRGVRPYDVHTKLYENKTVSFLVLQARVLATLEFRFDNRVAIQTMTRQTILDSGSAYEEGQPLINLPMSAERVRVSIFFKENLEGLMRCSLRSKGEIDVAKIARGYRGGGHATAAGFKLSAPLEVVLKEVLQSLRRYFED